MLWQLKKRVKKKRSPTQTSNSARSDTYTQASTHTHTHTLGTRRSLLIVNYKHSSRVSERSGERKQELSPSGMICCSEEGFKVPVYVQYLLDYGLTVLYLEKSIDESGSISHSLARLSCCLSIYILDIYTVRQGLNTSHTATEHAYSLGLHSAGANKSRACTVPLAEKQMCHPEDESTPQINQTIMEFFSPEDYIC